MVRSIPIRQVILCCLLSGSSAMIAAQAYTPPPPPLTTLPPCPIPKNAKDAKQIAKRKDCDPTNRPVPHTAEVPSAAPPRPGSAVNDFPYPGEEKNAGSSAATAKSFPYPGEAPAAAPVPPEVPAASPAKQFPFPAGHAGDRDGEYVADPNVPHDPAAERKAADTPAGQTFPYPGDPVPPAAPATTGDAPPSQSSSSSSTSAPVDDEPASKGPASKAVSDDDDDDGQPKLADKGSEGKRNKKTVKPQTDTERVDEDLSIAKFYGQSGNPMGAYLRARDAVKTEPEFPEARFVLGEAAERLKKVDEAKAEFSEYLKLAPDGEHARAAQKALADMR